MNSPIRTSRYLFTMPFGEYWIAYRGVRPDQPIGTGKTEQKAINNLLAQEDAIVDEDYNDNEEDHND